MEKTFIMKAANGGMMEVDLGKVAADKGESSEVKDFGKQMMKDHSKANEQLKDVASKMGVTLPSQLDATHQDKIAKLSGLMGAAFDKAYVKAMVADHKKDISEFEAASGKVKNPDLKKFIDETVPVMKEHLEMIQKFDQAKKS
jgi:putative membrane protein